MTQPVESLKDNFRAAQPVSKNWYNTVARAVKQMWGQSANLQGLPGYDASKVQALMNVNGFVRWVTVEECD